jgi:hypothetical protein
MEKRVQYIPQPYSVREFQEISGSMRRATGLTAHWIVEKSYGKCSCGLVDHASRVALFDLKEDALRFCSMMNARQEATMVEKVGDIPCIHGGPQ